VIAIGFFEQQGFDTTMINQIAAAADIAPRTFFSSFDSKDDVVLGDYADRLARIVGKLERRPRARPAPG
jgi:AcrR family transcriptional regulator